MSLRELKCIPCSGADPRLEDQEIEQFKREIPEWAVVEKDGIKRLEREFKFKNFREALDFTVKVGEQAESEDHHPRLVTEWGKVKVTWWTHVIKGLHKNDFIMAAKADSIYAPIND